MRRWRSSEEQIMAFRGRRRRGRPQRTCAGARHLRDRVRGATCISLFVVVAAAQGTAQSRGEQPFSASETPRCYGVIAAVGEERKTRAKAFHAAHLAWIARVGFDYGERYTDLNHAEDKNSVCALSSASRILKTPYFCCKIWARPCRPPPEDFSENSPGD